MSFLGMICKVIGHDTLRLETFTRCYRCNKIEDLLRKKSDMIHKGHVATNPDPIGPAIPPVIEHLQPVKLSDGYTYLHHRHCNTDAACSACEILNLRAEVKLYKDMARIPKKAAPKMDKSKVIFWDAKRLNRKAKQKKRKL